MSRRRATPMAEPAETLTPKEVAGRLRRSYDWFLRNRKRLEQAGFPKPMPVVGNYDAAAIEQWRRDLRRAAEPVLHGSHMHIIDLDPDRVTEILGRRSETIAVNLVPKAPQQ